MTAKRQPVSATVPTHPDREYHDALLRQLTAIAITVGLAVAKHSKYAGAIAQVEALLAMLKNRK